MNEIDYEGEDKLAIAKKWLSSNEKKPLFLTGETSSGKTTFIRTLLKDYVICEDEVSHMVENLNRKSFVKIACVVECIESLHITDIDLLAKVSTKKYKVPIVFTADDAYEKNFKSLRTNCEWILLRRPESPLPIMKKVLRAPYDDDILSFFLEFSNNNIKQALNTMIFYLKFSYEDEPCLQDVDVARIDFEKGTMDVAAKICQGIVEESSNEVCDNELILMLHENAASQAQGISASSKVNDLLSSFDISEKADENISDFILRYGVAKTVKSYKKTKLRFPSYYSFLSSRKNNNKTLKNDFKHDKIYDELLSLTQIQNQQQFKIK